MLKTIISTIISAIIGGLISGYTCLYKFNTHHTTMTVFEKDAQFLLDEQQNYINNNLYMEENKNDKGSCQR
jgi:hypothetical protein